MEHAPGIAVDDEELAKVLSTQRRTSASAVRISSSLHLSERQRHRSLVEFLPGRAPGLLRLDAMELDREAVLGRHVDLRTPLDLSRPRRRESSMTPPDDRVRFAHRREAAEKAVALGRGTSRHGLDDDEVPRLALTKLVEIVGDAAKQVSAEARVEIPPYRGRRLLARVTG